MSRALDNLRMVLTHYGMSRDDRFNYCIGGYKNCYPSGKFINQLPDNTWEVGQIKNNEKTDILIFPEEKEDLACIYFICLLGFPCCNETYSYKMEGEMNKSFLRLMQSH